MSRRQQIHDLGDPGSVMLRHPEQTTIEGPVVHGLRVLMVATEQPPHRGGIARVVDYLAEGLRGRGHQVDILAYPDVPRLCLGEVRLSGMVLKAPWLLRELNRYDILQVHGVTPTVSDTALFLARLRRKRPLIVYTHHVELDFGPIGLLNTVYNRVHHYLSAAADETVCSTVGPTSVFRDARPTSVIPFGIDPYWFAGESTKPERFTVLYVGQFRPWKSVPVLVEAVSRVHGARLIIAGSGPEEQGYRALGRTLGLDIEFQVGVDDEALRRLYQHAHVVVVPSTSRLEAFGLALVEGMAAGCVPVASNLPGVREVVGQTGFTFRPGSVYELSAILQRLRDEPRLVEEIGHRARARAWEYRHERTVTEYERLFLDLKSTRLLRNDLARGVSAEIALQEYAQSLASRADASRLEVRLQTSEGSLHKVASVASGISSSRRVAGMFDALACHVLATGESISVRPDQMLSLLPKHALDGWAGGGMAAPLESLGRRFGAVLAAREKPFDDRELGSWTRSARHAASVIQAS